MPAGARIPPDNNNNYNSRRGFRGWTRRNPACSPLPAPQITTALLFFSLFICVICEICGFHILW